MFNSYDAMQLNLQHTDTDTCTHTYNIHYHTHNINFNVYSRIINYNLLKRKCEIITDFGFMPLFVHDGDANDNDVDDVDDACVCEIISRRITMIIG